MTCGCACSTGGFCGGCGHAGCGGRQVVTGYVDPSGRGRGDWLSLTREPAPVPVGTRIRMISMLNDPAAIPPGTEGTVTGGNGMQMHVKWDNGRTLMVLPGEDRYEVIR